MSRKKNLVAALLISLLQSVAPAALAMDSSGPEALLSHARPSRTITSREALVAYGELMTKEAQNKNYASVLELAFPEPEIRYGPVSFSDLESYFYDRVKALYATYKVLNQENFLNPPLCISNYEKLLGEMQTYRDYFEDFTSTVKELNDRLPWSQFFVSHTYGEISFLLVKLKNDVNRTLDHLPEIEAYLRQSAAAYEKALELGTQLLTVDHVSHTPTSYNKIKDYLPTIQMALISVYTTLAQAVPLNESQAFITAARKIQKSFKEGQEKNFEIAAQSIEAVEKHLEANFKKVALSIEALEKQLKTKEAKAKPLSSKHAQRKRKEKISQIQGEAYALSEKQERIEDQPTRLISSKNDISLKQTKLNALIDPQGTIEDYGKKVAEGLIEIENDMRERLGQQQATSSSATAQIPLETVYEALCTLLGAENIITKYWKYVSCFVATGDVEGGIQRADILKNIEINHRGQASYKVRLIAAGLKNLLGDHEEWLAVTEEVKAQAEAKKEKKKAAKQRAHERKMEALRFSLVEQKEPAQPEAPLLQLPILPPAPVETKEKPLEEEASASLQQLKLEKQHRHAEAEQKRQEPAPEIPQVQPQVVLPEARPVPPQVLKRARRDAILATSNKTLAELYELASRPLKVNQEIEGGTWQFTREQFKTYVEAMGCTYQGGHGVHAKASLPEEVYVVRDGHLVTILNDFGGALTLPAWDKDFVPLYLRPQILEARKNLRALKILTLSS